MSNDICPVCSSSKLKFERKIKKYSLEKCVSCGIVFVSPRPYNKDVSDLYVDRSDDLDKLISIYQRTAIFKIPEYKKHLDLISRLLPGKGRLLDFACGAGHFFEQAQIAGWDAHGSELGNWAKIACESRNVSNIHIGQLQDINFPDEHFDVVYAAQVFEHLSNPRNDIKEISRILRSGGILYANVPNYRTLSIMLGKDRFTFNEPPQHINYFTPKSFAYMIKSSGFFIEHLTTEGGLNWENLLGRNIKSDIVDAYNIDKNAECNDSCIITPKTPSLFNIFKKLVKSIIVTPLLYKTFKIGISLTIIARKK